MLRRKTRCQHLPQQGCRRLPLLCRADSGTHTVTKQHIVPALGPREPDAAVSVVCLPCVGLHDHLCPEFWILPLKTAWQLVGKLLHKKGQKLILLYQCRPVFVLPVPVRLDGAQLLLSPPQLQNQPPRFFTGQGQGSGIHHRAVQQLPRQGLQPFPAGLPTGTAAAGPFLRPGQHRILIHRGTR